jgi:predicted dehydrogenase
VISENAYVSADFVARTGKVVRKIANDEQLADLRQRLKEGEDLSNLDYFELIETEDLDVQPGDALEMQIDDFIGAVREGRRPTIDAQAGFAAVRTAERIVETARAAGSRML